jgi:hypothetical protein
MLLTPQAAVFLSGSSTVNFESWALVDLARSIMSTLECLVIRWRGSSTDQGWIKTYDFLIFG